MCGLYMVKMRAAATLRSFLISSGLATSLAETVSTSLLADSLDSPSALRCEDDDTLAKAGRRGYREFP